MRKKLISIAASLCALSLLVACGGGGASAGGSLPALSIVTVTPPDGTAGSTYAGNSGFSFAATGGTAPYTWSWSAAAGSSLPPGLALSMSTGTVSGTPTTVGVYLLAINVRDSSSPTKRASFSCQIAVNDPVPLSITSPNPPNGILGAPYGGDNGFFLTAAGGLAPYIWTWNATAGSTLPPGLALTTNTGVISGSPTAIGTYSFTITVSDSDSAASQRSLTYSISVEKIGGMTISSGPLPSGTVGTLYGGVHVISGHQFSGFPLGVTGGVAPYTWTWSAAPGSSRPPGLSISVLYWGGTTRCCLTVPVVGGTPTAAGTYDVVLTVQDSATPPAQASANYTVIISP